MEKQLPWTIGISYLNDTHQILKFIRFKKANLTKITFFLNC